MTRGSLLAVERRLSAASEGSRELSNELMIALGFEKRSFIGAWGWWLDGTVYGSKFDPLKSIDAALALVSRCLPGKIHALAGPWFYAEHHEKAGQPIWYADLHDDMDGWGIDDLEHSAPTPALAICLALCRALLAKETE